MGLDKHRPPLPAPTDTSNSGYDTQHTTDVDTNVSTRTDKTSFSIPEDGTPVTINTVKLQRSLHKKYPSQTSLLIEYFDAGTPDDTLRSSPSVRVRVTPSSRRNKALSDHVRFAESAYATRSTLTARTPAYIRRISLANRDVHPANYWDSSDVESVAPVEIEVLSDVSSNGGRFVSMSSNVSSMPPDSLLGDEPQILPPGRRRSRSLDREEINESLLSDMPESLITPKQERSRSLSKDRITQRVMEKLQQQQAIDDAANKRKPSSKTSVDTKSTKRRSKDPRDEDVSAVTGTESNMSYTADRRSVLAPSMRSGVSGTSSMNNPKLLATVEDAIRRLILPELNALKEESRTSKNKDTFERTTRDSGTGLDSADSRSASREPSKRRVSNKPKVVLNRDGDDPGTVLSSSSSRKERRSSRGSISDRSYAELALREKSHRRKTKDKELKERSSRSSARDSELASLAGAGLTAAALRHHTSREEKEEERKHKSHRHKSSTSRSASVAESVGDDLSVLNVPALPFLHSELQSSDLTRDSILSAETETRQRPSSSSSKSTATSTAGPETPLQEVPRGYPNSNPRTPTRTPNAFQRDLGTSHSNRSKDDTHKTTSNGSATPKNNHTYTSQLKNVTMASLGMEAAAAAKLRAIERNGPQTSQYEIETETPPHRDVSPIQSEASYLEDAHATGSPRHLRSTQSAASVSSLGAERKVDRQTSDYSIASLDSRPSTKVAQRRKRPQGVNLESEGSVLGEGSTPQDAELFFEMNHEQNEVYRRELEESSQASPINDKRPDSFTDSEEGQYLDVEEQLNIDQDIRRVGSNPEYIHTPMAVESAVASLHNPSLMSASVMSPAVKSPLQKSRLSQVSPSPGVLSISDENIPSGARWGAIRDKAEALSKPHQADNSPRQSISHSIDETPQMHHSAFPAHHDMMPEIGYGVDDESDVTTNPSIIHGPLGGGDGYHEQTEEYLSRQESRERTPVNPYSNAAPTGPGAGAAIVAAAAHQLRDQSPSELSYDGQHQATVEDDYESYTGEPQYEQQSYAQSNRTPLSNQTGWKDEGYQSANQREAYTPQNRMAPKLFDDDGFGDGYDDTGLGETDMFASGDKHDRHLSGNSHGLDSPLYDAATGKGLDRIESKDIVALMDHLTVRDAQRNARDTEILVTLVRSAAEMRNQLDEMKQFIKTQDNMIMQTTDKRVGLAEQRILGGPRPQPFGSPRVPRSSSEDDIETKKKNVFKRALKGLSMKGDGDIKNIEHMLVQLLGEVEGLKQVQTLTLEQNRTNSLASYENLRASADPGYEPEGRANTNSSPNQSGYLSNPSSSRRIQDLHSGYDVVQNNRISTVDEDSDEYDERVLQYENTERMTTPTQEAMHNRSLSQEKETTPTQASRAFSKESQDTTPKRKHKSNSSSGFGIPKISRWSKTTASSNPESTPHHSGSGDKRPYSAHSKSSMSSQSTRSTHSRSGSQNNLAYYDDEPYAVREDDRRRSHSSLSRDDRSSMRSASPLIPDESELQYEMDDPKYQAHRNSLNLQHPQPRPGPTGRHQSHLEDAAQIYEPSNITSPDYDQWGSMPSLARNRMSAGTAGYGAGNLSPISSDGGYSGHSASEQQYASARPSKIVDDGPLIPQQQQSGTLAGYGQTRQMYSSPNEFGSQGALTPLAPIAEVRYSLETDRGYRLTPSSSPRSSLATPQRKITGPRPMGSRSPAPNGNGLNHSDTVIRRKPIEDDEESLLSYRSSLDSEIF
ncbi:hypothetical protein P153DRAFT_372322 [Dothidotthia symphoricarpi CBS 119687]|uniref:Uncharacterized protein n=1 Tax=Dothidotthia symphoricarpi CBS 119687 TaxID=1392245 RepID=A0A6A6ASA7_9PLEO|nr:uncharacterized protein P153DRAFT_372322 [Dothidotthia symphoricarpi CBS 119687]KAF2133727.1 hypothetical protein P153DRAFT_372322 [Dothidotthia symphoricarpi CBS 119687]